VRDEVAKHGGKATYEGVEVAHLEAGTTYHFENTGDTVLPQLEAQLAEIKRQVEHRKKFLMAAPPEGVDVIVDGGK
jgi:hypothetical protein